MRRLCYGFSLYELIVVITIIGILLTMALPSMYTHLIKHNIHTTYLQLEALVKYAQEEAIRRNSSQIIICPANFNINEILSSDNCKGVDGLWTKGVIAFIDLNNDHIYNSGERIQVARFDHSVAITVTSHKNHLNKLELNNKGQISNIVANEFISFDLRQAKFGICQYSRYELNVYGHFIQTAKIQPC